MQNTSKIIIAVGLVILSVVGRLIPHPWNMTPVAGSAIFAGVKLGKRYAVLVPLFAMLIGDAIIGFYNWQTLVTVYGSMMFIGLASYLSAQKTGTGAFLARPILASLLFFITTNAAVCFFGTMYPHSVSGLITSYISGLPFFGRDILGNILYTSLFFGVYEYAQKNSHFAFIRAKVGTLLKV